MGEHSLNLACSIYDRQQAKRDKPQQIRTSTPTNNVRTGAKLVRGGEAVFGKATSKGLDLPNHHDCLIKNRSYIKHFPCDY
jgi:hypothetical protein